MRRTRKNYSQSDLNRALTGDKNLTEADLRDANLTGENLTGADLTGAVLTGAVLRGAVLTGASLERADLYGADLTGAILTRAYLKDMKYDDSTVWPDSVRDVLRVWRGDANLTGENLTGADLTGAVLTGAVLRGAVLTGANLTRAVLTDSDLRGADLTGAILTRAYLKGVKYDDSTVWPDSVRDVLRVWQGDADLTGADLTDANLYRANLTEANLTEADLTGAILAGANLTRAVLTRAVLTGAILTFAKLTGAYLKDVKYDDSTVWPDGFTPPPERHLKRAYGSMTGPVLKFGKPEVPYRARDFKQKYPQEFDLLKRMTGGADFSPQFAENLRQTKLTPYDWIVTHGKYKAEAQRLCPKPNFLLKLNIDMDDERFTAQQKDVLRKLAETSRRSNHPYERDPLFTVGWVRICRDDAKGVWLVEEVQSDVQVVRQQKNDERLGNLRERLDEIVEVMQPYVDRFYEDALGITLIEAEKLGFDVEMIDYDTKKRLGYNPPRSVYRDLPASMGISAKRRSKVLPDLQEDVRWTRPNPRRRR
jgi:uncharacterized protein YjbI with pentapeptide repeats